MIASIEAKDTYYTGDPIPATVFNDVSPLIESAQDEVVTYKGIQGTDYEESETAPTEIGSYEAKMVIEDGINNEEHVATTKYKIMEPPEPPLPDNPTYIDATASTGDTNLPILALIIVFLACAGFIAYSFSLKRI